VVDPAGRLADLMELHLASRQVPLRLFPEASLRYAALAADPSIALRAAAKEFREGYQESAPDRAVQRLHGDAEPVSARPGMAPSGDLDLFHGFESLSVRVLGPLVEHLTEEIA